MVDGHTIFGCGWVVADSLAAGRGAGRPARHAPLRRVLLAGAAAAALAAGISVPARVEQGEDPLDARLRVGAVTTSLGDGNAMAAAIARTADGKLVVVGNRDAGGAQHIVVLRYGSDGTLDRTFGADDGADGTPDGVVDVSLGDGDDVATAVAVQPDGKILVAGHHVERGSSHMFLLRLDATGVLDAGFGPADDGSPDGVYTVSLGDGDDVLRGVAVAADGSIVVAGDSVRGDDAEIVVARFAADGTPDAGFGADCAADGLPDGFVSIDPGAGADRADALALAPDGSILMAGTHVADDGAAIVVARLTASGALDADFGTAHDGIADGVVAVSPGDGSSTASAIAIVPDGRIVVAGTSADRDGNANVVVAWLDPDGTPDGFVVTPLGGENGLATALALGADGTVLVGGDRQDGDGISMALARYTATGTLDAAFDDADGTADGIVSVSLGGGGDHVGGMVLDGDGFVVLAGSTAAAGRSNVALVRLALD